MNMDAGASAGGEQRLPPLRFGAGLVFSMLIVLTIPFMVIQPINALAYGLGFGRTVSVEVTKSSSPGSPTSRSYSSGEGRVIGENRTVQIDGVTAGETVRARTKLITTGSPEDVYRANSNLPYADFTGALAFIVVGLPALVVLVGGITLLVHPQLRLKVRWARSPQSRQDDC